MPHAAINGQSIYYEDTGGSGRPVVLGHGFLMDHEMFAPQVAALRDQYRVITWDERGFGLTEFDGQPFTYWDSASDCLGLMDHLGLETAVVGGMSQGGYLSLRVALTAPERVTALILLDSGAHLDDAEHLAGNQGMVDMWLAVGPVDDLANAVATVIIDDPDENPKWIAKWQAVPKENMAEPARCLLTRDDVSPRLGEITCPALVLHGTEDTAISMADAEAMAAGLVGCGGVVKVGGAHAANLTNPEPVNAAILDFLAGLPRMTALQIFGVGGLPEIEPGADLAGAILRAAADEGQPIVDGDVVVVTSKIVSKAEGRTVELADIEPSQFARDWSAQYGKDAAVTELVLRESKRVVRQIGPILITETHHGFVCANSGIDQSSSGAHGRVVLLPVDSDESARRIRAGFAAAGVNVAVIISDTFGRAWREGQTDIAIGIAGMQPILSYIGQVDPHGHEFMVQALCTADELAGAAELVKGNLSRVPVAVIRGHAWEQDDTATIAPVLRDQSRDLFR